MANDVEPIVSLNNHLGYKSLYTIRRELNADVGRRILDLKSKHDMMLLFVCFMDLSAITILCWMSSRSRQPYGQNDYKEIGAAAPDSESKVS